MAKLGWKYYILFCVLDAIFIVEVWLLFPETKGKTLEEVSRIFDRLENPGLIDVESSSKMEDENEKEKVVCHEISK